MGAAPDTAALTDYQWLVSAAAEPFLSAAEQTTDPLERAARLRASLPSGRARLVAEQAALRGRATKKFSAAQRLFFTPLGLEQATDEWIARHKAARFLGRGGVLDLCCGIGGDAMALAAAQPVMAVDRDPISLLLAEANCRLSGSAAPNLNRFRSEEVTAATLQPGLPWHIDPDRRPAGRRTTAVERHDPPAEVLDQLLSVNSDAAIKLAPAAEVPAHWESGGELEWISFDRECRQLVVWFGSLAQAPGKRRASIVDRQGGATSMLGSPADSVDPASTIGRYLFEPDPAVIAAGLTGSLAQQTGVSPLAAGAIYLTGDRLVDQRTLAAFEVLLVLPFDMRRIKRELRERRIGQLEVKKRGVTLDPAKIARQLVVPGDHSATLLITRRSSAVIAILATRVVRALETENSLLSWSTPNNSRHSCKRTC